MPRNIRYDKDICTGCSKGPVLLTFPYVHRCTVYARIPGAYLRAGLCPFNPPVVETKKKRVRVGQQKTKRVF